MEQSQPQLQSQPIKDEQQQQQQTIKTKEELINNIKEWIKVDNELTKLKAEVKERTLRKKNLTDALTLTMKTNSIGNFDVKGGSIVYKQKKSKKQISCKFLKEQLAAYYKENPELASDIAKHVLDNREQVVKDELHRKMDKTK